MQPELNLELDLVPNGNLVVILTNLEQYDGSIMKALDVALMSKSSEDELEKHSTTRSQRTRTRSNVQQPLWGSHRVRQTRPRFDGESPSIRVRLASEHFSHVSPIFKLFMSCTSDTGTESSSTKDTELGLPDDDAAAMIIVLLVLFNMPNEVARKVSVQALCSICVLIDKYELHAPLSLHTDGWYKNLKHALPTNMTPDFMTWLCITHVLDQGEDLSALADIAQMFAKGPLDGGMMPLPGSVLDPINLGRIKAISDIRAVFEDLIDRYKTGQLTCYPGSFRCNCLQLGALELNKVSSAALVDQGFDGYSVDGMAAEILQMGWPDCVSDRDLGGNECDMRTAVREKVKVIRLRFRKR